MGAALFGSVLASLLPSAATGQRNLPETQVFESPGRLLLDASAESPAVYNGVRAAPAPAAGQSIAFQVFAPEAAGRNIFQFGLHLAPSSHAAPPLRIVSVVDWTGAEVIHRPASSFQGTRPGLDALPPTGYVCTVTLRATGVVDARTPLDIGLSVTAVSDPPRRVHQMKGQAALGWL